MKTVDLLPDRQAELLEGRGIMKSAILSAVRSDMTADLAYGDVWAVLTADEVAVLETARRVEKDGGAGFGKNKIKSVEEVVRFEHIPLGEIDQIKTEEGISSSALTAVDQNGEYRLLFRFSGAIRANAGIFSKQLRQVKEKGNLDGFVLEDKRELFCPKCGLRYPDPERKLCPKCLSKIGVLKKLLPFFKRYKGKTLLMLLMVLLTSGLGILSPYIGGRFLIDDVIDKSGKYYGEIVYAIAAMAGVALLSTALGSLQSIVNAKIAARVTYDLKKTMFSSVQRLSLGFFSGRQTGGLMTQINSDANTIYWFFCDGVPYLIVNLCTLVGITALMVSMNPFLTLLVFLPVPLFLGVQKGMLVLYRKLAAKNFSKSREYSALVADVLSGARIVKAFARENLEVERFNKKSEEYAQASLQYQLMTNRLSPFVYFLLQLGLFIAWGAGGYMVIRSRAGSGAALTYGMLVTFISLLNMVYNPLNYVNQFVRTYSDFINSVHRLFEIMEAEPDVKEKEHPVVLDELRGEVEFDNVSFSYGKHRKAVDGVSFRLEPGKTLGIVGHTGAGKSTLVNLLMRLYDVSDGAIRIDGVDIRELSLSTLHDNIAIVSQETYLFRGTIAENIAYAVPDAGMEQIIAAAKIAGAHEFIIRNPEGYNTQIGFGNKDLSGGERQRISIARAVLKNPKILILDEATASMDTKTEKRIQEALEKLTRGRTTIIIAHRLCTLRNADTLIVIENGKMTESGTHVELIDKQGSYYRLYKMQLDALKVIGVEG